MSYKLITAIMLNNEAIKIIESLKVYKGIITADRSNARGSTIKNTNGVEMAVVTILVEEKVADDIFEYVFFEANINQPNKGIIYQQDIKRSSKYLLSEDQ